ncbi:MAG: hypothetical protein ACR2N7_05375 [Acidimicrobiia bacterium]
MLAATTELKWIMHELLCTLPVRFAEGTSELQSWNEEGVWRDKSPELIEQLQTKLFNDITENLQVIAAGGVDDEEQGMNVSLIGPTVEDPLPGAWLGLSLEDC